MFVGNHPKFFSRLVYRKVGVELGTAAEGHFDGVGIMTISFPQYKNCLFLLYPSFLSTTDKCCTISNGALMKFSGFKRVLIDTNQQLDLTLQDNRTLSLPFITKDCIDYIKIHIHISSKGTNNVRNAKQRRLSYRHMSLQPVSITNKNIAGTVLFSYWLLTVQPQIKSNTSADDRQRLHYRTWTTMQTSTTPRKMSHM